MNNHNIPNVEEPELSAIQKLSKDLKDAVTTLTPHEVRFLVDSYYSMQENRIRADSQIRAMTKSGEPHSVLDWLSLNSSVLENQIKAALDYYSKNNPVGAWSRSQIGIGPVIAAGLLAHIDITKAPTAGHIWSFAGISGHQKWEKGQKRPWNAELKRLCWIAASSFVKFSYREDCYYGQVYLNRKAVEIQKNDAGDYKAQALVGAGKVGKSTDTWSWNVGCYPAGTMFLWARLADSKAREYLLKEHKGDPGSGQHMLSPGHIHARAMRYAVKLFLAHWHEIAYKEHYKTDPPKPYAIAFLGHAHKINPPMPTIESE